MQSSSRLDLVDALRGFALLAIVLLHNLEHYNLITTPEGMPEWLQNLDSTVWNATFFLMAGKAFSTFSLLFGFSFYIQFHNAHQRGESLSGRFAWRMFLLLCFAALHTIFYNGDILIMYAIIGLFIIPLARVSNRVLLYLGTIFILQPLEWIRIGYALLNPHYQLPEQLNAPYWQPVGEAMSEGSFIEVVCSNFTDGTMANVLWQVENGRLFLIPALFIFGILLGREGYFINSSNSHLFWKRVVKWTLSLFIPLYLLKSVVPDLITSSAILIPYNTAIGAIFNGMFMSLLVAIFSLLWFSAGDGYRVQRLIIPYGRMSLTNYITQSIIGVYIYLGFGLGLYQYLGATASIIVGCVIIYLQLLFSRYWLARHKQGPLEYLWKRLTFIGR